MLQWSFDLNEKLNLKTNESLKVSLMSTRRAAFNSQVSNNNERDVMLAQSLTMRVILRERDKNKPEKIIGCTSAADYKVWSTKVEMKS